MNKALRRVTAAHKILITDACHSGGVTTEGSRGALEINDINKAFLDRISSSRGVHTTFTASGETQVSMEGEQWGGGHGVFTYFLMKALAGAADENQDHIVDLGEMMKFVTDSVSKATSRRQTPTTGPTAYNAAFPVAMVIPGQEIASIGIDEIAKYSAVSNVMTQSMESAWIPPDSMTLVAGMPDTIRIRLQNDKQDVLPPTLLKWGTGNPLIATVDVNGVVTPLAAGHVQISASRETRKVTTLIHVMPRPSDVLFFPSESSLDLVLTESFRVRTDLLIGKDQWMRGMPPRLTLSDTLVLRQKPDLEFEAYREGTAKLTASIGGKSKEWNVRVIPPGVKIATIPLALPANDSLPLVASRIRPDGTVLGDAPNAQWRSLDTTRAVIRNGQLKTRGIGKVILTTSLGNAVDSVTTFILGDLLVATDGNGGPNISTIGIASGQSVALLPKGTTGGEPSLSPKGDRIAFVSNKRVYVMDTDGANPHRLISDMKGLLGVRVSSYEEHSPSWTNDGSRLVFISNAHGNYEVLSAAPDGTDIRRLTNTSEQERNVAAAADAPLIAFERILSTEAADIVTQLPDGSQEQQLHVDIAFGMEQYSSRKPKFMPGGTEILYARRWGARGGESLHLMDAKTGETTKNLLPQQADNSLTFAVSPDGQRIAYHRIADWGKNNNSIVIMDRGGMILKTISVGEGVEIKSINWGASPLHAKGSK